MDDWVAVPKCYVPDVLVYWNIPNVMVDYDACDDVPLFVELTEIF